MIRGLVPTRTPLLCGLLLTLLSCAGSDGLGPEFVEPLGDARAYGLWAPGPRDSCSKAMHDGYSTVGPDGLRYPTWHPAVDPATGCTFGHEHGRDPAESDLFDEVGPIPFGYANEHLVEGGFGEHRHEDHVGHKIEWQNDMEMSLGDGASAFLTVRCDVLVKMHQGTHSADAFTNNMHEVVYHIRCTDGTGFSATLLTPIGRPGELVVGCDRERHIPVGIATPPNSPEGGGKRAIPEAACVQESVLGSAHPHFDSALRESWEISASLRAVGGEKLAAFNPYFQAMDPSRYYDAARRQLVRPIDLCYVEALRGRDRCEGLPTAPIAFDDPRSPFKGVRRFVDINGNTVRNGSGPTVWYTDALGRNGRTEPFPGSIRQWIAAHDNEGLDLHGPVIGKDRDYDAPGVHAPN
jgi:hypothetical protein